MRARVGRSCEHFGGYETTNGIPLSDVMYIQPMTVRFQHDNLKDSDTLLPKVDSVCPLLL